MSLILRPDAVEVVDRDLLDKIESARGTSNYSFTIIGCKAEQERRNALNVYSRDKRRRLATRAVIEQGPPVPQDMRHIHSVLAICGLPYKRLPDDTRDFERKQGNMALDVSAGYLRDTNGNKMLQPVPFGPKARLILMHLCSEAIRQKSATIDIAETFTGFVRDLGFSDSGGKKGPLTAFTEQLNALSACTMRMSVWTGERVRTRTISPIEEIDLWLAANPGQRSLWPSTVTFSSAMYDSLKRHALPVNVKAVRAFAGSARTKSGRKFSVEVKTRNRAATEDGPVDDIKRLRVASKLNRALAKKADHARVVMIEVNVPDIIKSKDEVFNGWPKAALAQIRDAEAKPAPDGSEKPSAYVVATNHAFHNNLEAVDVGSQVITTGFKIDDFGPDVPFNSLKAVLESERRHQEIFALIDSMRDHYEIPSTFNGENPELAFQEKSDVVPPLRLGEWYAVPGPDGKEVPARLMDALVDETKKSVMGVYQTCKNSFMVTCPLSDAELAAWKRHPDTFFGEVRQKQRRADNWLELAKFFYKTYKHTPREKLLEWMKGATDYEKLTTLSQEELAIAYCERTAWAANKDQKVA